MTISEAQRNELHNRLVEVLGGPAAGTLMSYLPPVGWADVATKQNISILESRLQAQFDGLRAEFGELRSGIDTRLLQMEVKLGDKLRSQMFGMFAMLGVYSGLIAALLRIG